MLPLGQVGTAGVSLVVVFLSSSVVVSVATTDTTTADYPADTQLGAAVTVAIPGQPVRTQCIKGSPRASGR